MREDGRERPGDIGWWALKSGAAENLLDGARLLSDV